MSVSKSYEVAWGTALYPKLSALYPLLPLKMGFITRLLLSFYAIGILPLTD